MFQNANREGSANFSIVTNFLLSQGGAVGSVNLLGRGDFIFAGEVNLGQPLLIRAVHIGEATTERQFEHLLKLSLSWRYRHRPCLVSKILKRSVIIKLKTLY